MTLYSIMTPDGRRAWAFMAICGGCAVFTLFAVVGVWLVSDNAEYAFYLALAAHAQVFLGMAALGSLLVKRTMKIGRDGLEFDDKADAQTTTVTVETKGEVP